VISAPRDTLRVRPYCTPIECSRAPLAQLDRALLPKAKVGRSNRLGRATFFTLPIT
jgi:hypothetical protein